MAQICQFRPTMSFHSSWYNFSLTKHFSKKHKTYTKFKQQKSAGPNWQGGCQFSLIKGGNFETVKDTLESEIDIAPGINVALPPF